MRNCQVRIADYHRMAVLGLGVKYRERRYLMRNTREIGLFPRVSGEGAVPIPEDIVAGTSCRDDRTRTSADSAVSWCIGSPLKRACRSDWAGRKAHLLPISSVVWVKVPRLSES